LTLPFQFFRHAAFDVRRSSESSCKVLSLSESELVQRIAIFFEKRNDLLFDGFHQWILIENNLKGLTVFLITKCEGSIFFVSTSASNGVNRPMLMIACTNLPQSAQSDTVGCTVGRISPENEVL